MLSLIGLLTLTTNIERAEADQYDPQRAGNPIRIAAYILHPVGVLLDYGLMRPCFYVIKREPFSTIFGYVPPPYRDLQEQEQPHPY
jgi:hypothetical protein